MTTADINKLSGLLIQYDMEELKTVEKIAVGDRDFKKLKSIYAVEAAIATLLEHLETQQ